MFAKHSQLSRLIGVAAVILSLAVGTANAGSTPQGLKADGLRLQAMADRYQQMRGMTPAGITADGLRLQAIARAYQSRPAASYYTPRALHADALRWQRLAQAYSVPTASGGSGFDWADASVGAAGGLGFVAFGVVALVFARRLRRAKLAL